MKRFYKTWFQDMNKKVRPNFRTPPNLTAAKMIQTLEKYVTQKIPGLLSTHYILQGNKDLLLEDLMYLIFSSHYKKKEPFLTMNDPRFT
jgi:hypothetical protein